MHSQCQTTANEISRDLVELRALLRTFRDSSKSIRSAESKSRHQSRELRHSYARSSSNTGGWHPPLKKVGLQHKLLKHGLRIEIRSVDRNRGQQDAQPGIMLPNRAARFWIPVAGCRQHSSDALLGEDDTRMTKEWSLCLQAPLELRRRRSGCCSLLCHLFLRICGGLFRGLGFFTLGKLLAHCRADHIHIGAVLFAASTRTLLPA